MKICNLLAFFLTASFATQPVAAAINISVVEDLSGVTISFSAGSLDLDGLSQGKSTSIEGEVYSDNGPSSNLYIAATSSSSVDLYSSDTQTITGPDNFGATAQTDYYTSASSFSGQAIGYEGEQGGPHFIYVPTGYISGSIIASGSNEYSGLTLADMGFAPIPGVYVIDWVDDSITITTSVVPEPSAYTLIAGLAFLSLGLLRRRVQ